MRSGAQKTSLLLQPARGMFIRQEKRLALRAGRLAGGHFVAATANRGVVDIEGAEAASVHQGGEAVAPRLQALAAARIATGAGEADTFVHNLPTAQTEGEVVVADRHAVVREGAEAVAAVEDGAKVLQHAAGSLFFTNALNLAAFVGLLDLEGAARHVEVVHRGGGERVRAVAGGGVRLLSHRGNHEARHPHSCSFHRGRAGHPQNSFPGFLAPGDSPGRNPAVEEVDPETLSLGSPWLWGRL